jgi:hypothetical protein
MNKLALAVGLLLGGAAYAGTATVTYTIPTTRVGGTALPAGEIKAHRIEWGSCSGTAFGTKIGESIVGPAVNSVVIPNLTEGQTYCFRAFSQDTLNRWSAASNVDSKLIPLPPPPNPPVITTVAVVAGLNMSPAYRILADGTRGSAVIGFVPVGTECGAKVFSYRGVTYGKVARDKVKWWNTSPTDSVATACAAG